MKKIVKLIKDIDSKLLTPKPVLQKGFVKIDPNLRWQHLYYGLFVQLKRGEISNDRQIAKYLKISSRTQSYLTAKNEFIDTLVLTSYLLRDEINELDRTDLKLRLEQSNLNVFSIRNLLGSATVENAFKNILKKSEKQRFSFLIARTALRLMSVYDIIAPNDKRIQYYAEMYLKYEEIYSKEQIISDKYEDVFIVVRTTFFGLGNITKSLDHALEISSNILDKWDSYDLKCFDFRLRHLKALDNNSVKELELICDEAIDYFYNQKMDSFGDMSVYKYQKAIAKLHLDLLDESLDLLNGIIRSKKTKRQLKMSSKFLKLVILFKEQDYEGSISLINSSLNKDFNSDLEYTDLGEWLIYIKWLKVIHNLGLYTFSKIKMKKLLGFEKMIDKSDLTLNLVDLLYSISEKHMSNAALDLINLEKMYKPLCKNQNGKRHEVIFSFIKSYIENKGNVGMHISETTLGSLAEIKPNYLSEYFEYEIFPYDIIVKALS